MARNATSNVRQTTPLEGTVRVEVQGPVDAWNEYVSRSPGGLYHRTEWGQVFAVYRLPYQRLAAVRKGRIVGVLPLVWQRSLLFGNHFVSLPCFDTTGVMADDPEARTALIDKAREMAAEAGVETVLLRQAAPLDLSPHVRNDKVLMRRRLEPDPGALWDALKPKVRNQIRKPRKHGLVVERGGGELLSDFFAVYSENMRDLGSPSHSRRFFQAAVDAFAKEVAIYVVRFEGKVVGAAFTMPNGDRLEIPWASSLQRYNGYCVNHLMYWQLLEDACLNGYQWFHFGRSTYGSGTYHFKKQWGAEPLQLHWYYLASTPKAAAKASSMQESYGWGSSLWKKLPLWMSRSLGPKIIAKVP